jgi:arylsulfatase A-like enzyme
MTERRGSRAPSPPAAPRPSQGAIRASLLPGRASQVDAASRPAPLLAGIPLGWRMADAYLALAALALAEVVVVGVAARREFVGLYEISRAVMTLTPIALAAAGPIALAAGVMVELVRHSERPGPRAVTAILAAAFMGAVAFGVSTGRFFAAGTGRRVPFVVGAACLVLAGVFAIAPAFARAIAAPRDGRGRLKLLGIVAAIVIALEVVNRAVLPRLYPPFHWGLTALALFAAAFATLALPSGGEPGAGREPRSSHEPRSSREPRSSAFFTSGRLARVVLALLLFTGGSAAAPAAARKLARSDNVRLIYLDRAPILAHVVALGAVIAPPDPLDDSALPEEMRAGGSATIGAEIDLQGRDVVLITIDALRADHVGAYGYNRKTTPNIDKLAAEGAVFEYAYTPTPHTSYAVTSLMTGKYMRPLLLQGLGGDSETWAQHLRRYGYRTAAFYPPAVFFIDADRLASFQERALDFEYKKVQFAGASDRAREVRAYLERPGDANARLFLWVHLFEPHEPYEAHAEHPFGDRDIDRYDAEIAAADAGLGAIVDAVREARPNAVIIATADHGEEFLEHGGRYHGTTVYEEQVRVPLVMSAPGLVEPRRVEEPVQLIDLLPTVLAGLDIPRPARVRGRSLGPLLTGRDEREAAAPPPDGSDGSGERGGEKRALPGFAFSETDTQTLLARGPLRLVCARKIGACALYDITKDPGQTADVSALRPADLADMRSENRALEASHGRYEVRGLRSEGKGWPEALRRGIAGDADAGADVAALLDDADVAIRRKAGEVLFDLKRPETAAALRLALLRDEDDEVRRWAALALTRLGEGAPRTRELLEDRELRWRRLAALALAEANDDRGEAVLIAWWREAYAKKPPGGERKPIPFERAREIAEALAKIKAKDAVPSLLDALDDVRLRPHLAAALAAIGSDAARPALAKQLEVERYQTARIAIAEALVKLGAGPELRAPLIRLLGTPDPLPGGLQIALAADVLDLVGGPRPSALTKLRKFARSGVAVSMVVPKPIQPKGAAPVDTKGVRVICRARSMDGRRGEVRFGLRAGGVVWGGETDKQDSLVPSDAPELDPERTVILTVASASEPAELFATLPPSARVKPGDQRDFVVYATQNVEVIACAVVPLSDELPPPPPEPWEPSEADEGADAGKGAGADAH